MLPIMIDFNLCGFRLDVSLAGGLDSSGAGQIGNPLPSASTLDLCPDCFAGRVEIGSHKSFHNYQVLLYCRLY